jgi:hypothetical protein
MLKLNVASEKESYSYSYSSIKRVKLVSTEITGILRKVTETDVSSPQFLVQCEAKI